MKTAIVIAALVVASMFGLGHAQAKPLPGTLIVSPDPAPVYGDVSVTGCGFEPNEHATFLFTNSQAAYGTGTDVDGDGCLVPGVYSTNIAGAYNLKAWQHVSGPPSHMTLMAETNFTVQ